MIDLIMVFIIEQIRYYFNIRIHFPEKNERMKKGRERKEGAVRFRLSKNKKLTAVIFHIPLIGQMWYMHRVRRNHSQ